MISPSRQAMLVFLSLILLSVQETKFKDRISVQETNFKDRISVQESKFKDQRKRDGRVAKEGSDGLRHKNNQKEERSKKAQKDQLAKSHLGMKSENRNLKAEKKRNVRKPVKDIHKKKRKSSSKYRKNQRKKEKTKIKWRIQKRRMKSSKIQEAQKFERSREGELNLTDCVDKIKFYSRLSVPSRKASSIIKQANRIRGNKRILKAKQEKSGNFDDTMLRLLDALGGNASNPVCRGEEILNGSVEATYAGALATLLNCDRDISDACRHPENETRSREIKSCKDLANDFMSDFEDCLQPDLDLSATCQCADKINATNIVSIQNCDLSKYSSDVLRAKKSCKETVMMCKSAQAKAVAAIDECKEEKLVISFQDLLSKCS